MTAKRSPKTLRKVQPARPLEPEVRGASDLLRYAAAEIQAWRELAVRAIPELPAALQDETVQRDRASLALVRRIHDWRTSG